MLLNLGADPLADFKDQKTGLVVFGILLIVLGCITGLLAPAMAAMSGFYRLLIMFRF